MARLDIFLNFCRKFHNIPFPKIRIGETGETYRYLYRTMYNIEVDDIDKASAFIFFLCLISIIVGSYLFLTINVFFVIGYALIISSIVTYVFNKTLYRKIKKEQAILDALLYLIKIKYSLGKKTHKGTFDYCIYFTELLANYNLSISRMYKSVLGGIQIGDTPEDLLLEVVTPSDDFNQYVRRLLDKKFTYENELSEYDDSSPEKSFRVILRDIEAKISIVFFVGLFFPIGLCFLLLFQQINTIALLAFIPIFLLIINFLFRSFIKINVVLIGVLQDHTGVERKKFDEFLLLLDSFALNLKSERPPENAFIEAFKTNRSSLKFLNDLIGIHVSRLVNGIYTFNEIIESLEVELKSLRYSIILDAIKEMVEESAYYTARKIEEILEIIFKHRELEKKFDEIIKGERFKVFIFLFLLPFIIGAIGGMLPLMSALSGGLESTSSMKYKDYKELINVFDLIIIFLTLFVSNLISCHYFLKIINFKNRTSLFIISSLIFILAFCISFFWVFEILV